MGNLPLRNPGVGSNDTFADDGRGSEEVFHLAFRIATNRGPVQSGLDLVVAFELFECLVVLLRCGVRQHLIDAENAPHLARFRSRCGKPGEVGIGVLLRCLVDVKHGAEGQLGGAADQFHHVIALNVGSGDDDVSVTRRGHRCLTDSQAIDTFLDDVLGQLERVLVDR